MLPFSLCNKKRPLFPTTLSIPSNVIGKYVGLRTYEHSHIVKGKLSVQSLEDAKLQSHQPCQMGLELWTILEKHLYQRCVAVDTAQFAEMHAAFKLNTGILGIKCWVGLCINRMGPFLQVLVCCSY